MRLERHRQDWEELAEQDPLWAILSDPAKAHGAWDIDEFFATGREEIDRVMAQADRLRLPRQHGRALDFGSGYGRLTRAISDHFDSTVGVDISAEMVRAASRLGDADRTIEFVVNDRDDLSLFGPSEFDFVYSNIVLQHVPNAEMIPRRYVAEFVRVLTPGGLVVFQLPTEIPFRYRLQPRRRAYTAWEGGSACPRRSCATA